MWLQQGREYDLSIALNYGQATGSPQLMRWVTEHTELVANPICRLADKPDHRQHRGA